MNKLKLFISSRVNSSFEKLDGKFSLGDLCKYIRSELESQIFPGEKILEIKINEESFDSTIAKNAFDNCMTEMRSCNIIIILYNGEAGWSVAGSDSSNGICHEEFLIAMNEFSDMSFMLDLSGFFQTPKKNSEQKKNEAFANDVAISYQHKTQIKAKNVDELKTNVLNQIKQYVLKAFEKSFATQKEIVSGSSVFGATLDWSKLGYSERQKELKSNLEKSFHSLHAFREILKSYHAIPDNMSVSDARNSIGRPFINEHNLIVNKKEDHGVIHFVAVYGNATEAQVKNLVGYPDLAVIKASFGFYLWEKDMHIQMFFLKNCINPQTVKTRFSELVNWLTSSREQSKIIARAKARFMILDAVNKTKEMEGI